MTTRMVMPIFEQTHTPNNPCRCHSFFVGPATRLSFPNSHELYTKFAYLISGTFPLMRNKAAREKKRTRTHIHRVTIITIKTASTTATTTLWKIKEMRKMPKVLCKLKNFPPKTITKLHNLINLLQKETVIFCNWIYRKISFMRNGFSFGPNNSTIEWVWAKEIK